MLITYTNSAIANSNMTVDVLYIAGSVDKSDYCCEERMTVQQSTSLADLYNVLSQKHHFNSTQSQSRVALNDHFVEWTEVIYDGDDVVFISPVARG